MQSFADESRYDASVTPELFADPDADFDKTGGQRQADGCVAHTICRPQAQVADDILIHQMEDCGVHALQTCHPGMRVDWELVRR